MLDYHHRITRWILLVFVILTAVDLQAQVEAIDSFPPHPDNEFSISAKMTTRGELRHGGFNPDSTDNNRTSMFIMGQYRIDIGYKRSSWFELKLAPQMSGVWGQSSISLTLAEAWAQMRSRVGVFAKIGRQTLEYDDERILGYDDWTMTAPTHDVLKFGYEGHGHKVHALLAYNQNPENQMTGGNYYSGGIQPYKTMQTLWYHYETPKSFFGISLIGMNIGMQSLNLNVPNKTFYQQLVGTYVTLKPKFVTLEGAFYYQMGKEEYGIPLDAFMGSGTIKVSPSKIYTLYAGYDYLSGDKYFAVPSEGSIGLVYHDKIRGFCPIFGSHHDFYGAMDFFYLNSYVSNFTPGLQNLYTGASVNPIQNLNLNASYHFFAIATDLDYLDKPLGHELELSASYTFARFIKVAAGYSFMRGTKTMQVLQHLSENRQLHWGWVMLSVTPTIFTHAWTDKKNL